MSSEEGYRETDELKNITTEIILAWKEKYKPPIYLVRIQKMCMCPLEHKLVPETKCRGCPHCYGDASPRELYCLPKTNKIIGARSIRKKEKKNER